MVGNLSTRPAATLLKAYADTGLVEKRCTDRHTPGGADYKPGRDGIRVLGLVRLRRGSRDSLAHTHTHIWSKCSRCQGWSFECAYNYTRASVRKPMMCDDPGAGGPGASRLHTHKTNNIYIYMNSMFEATLSKSVRSGSLCVLACSEQAPYLLTVTVGVTKLGSLGKVTAALVMLLLLLSLRRRLSFLRPSSIQSRLVSFLVQVDPRSPTSRQNLQACIWPLPPHFCVLTSSIRYFGLLPEPACDMQ